jgi:hypothetical protein
MMDLPTPFDCGLRQFTVIAGFVHVWDYKWILSDGNAVVA